jgi:hypothetical protein
MNEHPFPTKSLDYNCKICGKPGTAHYDPGCPIKTLESWRTALCCDRCYNFRGDYSRLKRAAELLCVSFFSFMAAARDQETRREAEARTRQQLHRLTHKIADVCSEFYLVEKQWSDDFVDTLMDKPRASGIAIAFYRRGIENLSQLKTTL